MIILIGRILRLRETALKMSDSPISALTRDAAIALLCVNNLRISAVGSHGAHIFSLS